MREQPLHGCITERHCLVQRHQRGGSGYYGYQLGASLSRAQHLSSRYCHHEKLVAPSVALSGSCRECRCRQGKAPLASLGPLGITTLIPGI